MSLYAKRGVSAQKEEVHAATKNMDKGIYPKAFCKVYEDVLGDDKDWVNVMHADGAGTKSILAYLYWKQTGDAGIHWKRAGCRRPQPHIQSKRQSRLSESSPAHSCR